MLCGNDHAGVHLLHDRQGRVPRLADQPLTFQISRGHSALVSVAPMSARGVCELVIAITTSSVFEEVVSHRHRLEPLQRAVPFSSAVG